MPDVRLVDLEVIKRFSLAVRGEHADAQDVLDAIEADRAELRKALDKRGSGATKRSSNRSTRRTGTGTKGTDTKSTGGKAAGTKSSGTKSTRTKGSSRQGRRT